MGNRQLTTLLRKSKRGLASLFVCAVVLFPIFSFGWLVHVAAQNADKRKAEPLPAFSMRPIDKTNRQPALFKEPLISVSFDDGWESTYTVAAPLFQKYGLHTTQYVLPGTVENDSYLSTGQIKALHDAGQDMECHTMDHFDITALGEKDLEYQLKTCKSSLESITKSPVHDFASPYGHTNTSSLKAIEGTYRSHRNTNGDISNDVDEFDVNLESNFKPYDIIGVTVRRDTPTWQIKQAIDYTIANKGWLVITYHQIDDGPSKFGLDKQVLEEQLAYISSAKARISPISEVLNAYYAKVGY